MKKLYWMLLSGCILNATEPLLRITKQSIIPVLFPEEYRPKNKASNLEQGTQVTNSVCNNEDIELKKRCTLEYFREKLEGMSREIRGSQFVLPLVNNGQILSAQYPDTCNKHNRFLLVALSRLLESKPLKSLEHCLYNIERALIVHSKLPPATFFTDKDFSSIKEMFEGLITRDPGGKFVLNFINAGYLKDYLNISSSEDTDLRLGVQEVEKMVYTIKEKASGRLQKKLSVLGLRVKQFMDKYMKKREFSPYTPTTSIITKNSEELSEFAFLNHCLNQTKNENDSDYAEVSFYYKNAKKIVSYPVQYVMFDGGVGISCLMDAWEEKQITDLDEQKI